MQLTNQQIDTINETLVLNGLKYDDIKLEVTDHIASEIEVLMEENSLSFEESTQMVFEKWEPQLKPTTYGLLLGNHFSGPKIAMDKLAHAAIGELKWVSILALLLTVSIFTMFRINHNIDFLILLGMSFKTLIIIGAVIAISVGIVLLKSKQKTVFSTLFRKRFFLTLFYPITIMLGISDMTTFHRNLEIKVFPLAFTIVFLLFLLNSFRLLAQHFKFVKKITPLKL
jgi:hypothetical protein